MKNRMSVRGEAQVLDKTVAEVTWGGSLGRTVKRRRGVRVWSGKDVT